jgi:hypothetical protein
VRVDLYTQRHYDFNAEASRAKEASITSSLSLAPENLGKTGKEAVDSFQLLSLELIP